MVNRPRNIGTAAETAVVNVLRANGWPAAERRQLRGRLDCGDITGTPGLVWEIKGGATARQASDNLVAAWLTETERERVNAAANVGVLVVTRKGIGPANAGQWWAVLDLTDVATLLATTREKAALVMVPPALVRLRLTDACHLLRVAGYGTPLPTPDPPMPTTIHTLTEGLAT